MSIGHEMFATIVTDLIWPYCPAVPRIQQEKELEAITDAMLEETFDERTDRALAWKKQILDEKGWRKIREALTAR